jgi:hypothetical protein
VAPTTAQIDSVTGGTIQFTATDPNLGAITYSLQPDPAGYAINSSTGLVTVDPGFVAQSINVRATDISGLYTTAPPCNVTASGASTSPWPTQTPTYTPIVRNFAGPGLDTTAGSPRGSGTPAVYLVNDLSNTFAGSVSTSGLPANVYRGSVRDCLNHHNTRSPSGPSTICFEMSGNIDLNVGDLVINRGQLTIAGATAPAPGVQFVNSGLVVSVSDIYVSHITWRAGPVTSSGQDIVTIGESFAANPVCHRIVFDQCTFAHGQDENFVIFDKGGAASNDQISVLRSILHDPTDSPSGGFPKHWLTYPGSRRTAAEPSRFMSFGNLVSGSNIRTGSLSQMTHNFFANNLLYNPFRATNGDMAEGYGMIYNNIVAGADDRHVVTGNIFRKGPNSNSEWNRQVNLYTGSVSGTQLYIGYNYAWNGGGTTQVPPTDTAQFAKLAGSTPSGVTALQGSTSNLAWRPQGLTFFGDGDNNISGRQVSDLFDVVTRYTGARPGETRARVASKHDTLTAKVVDDARSNYSGDPLSIGTSSNGANISVATAQAAKPTYPTNSYNLFTGAGLPAGLNPLPADWTVLDGAYSKLERWLHEYENATI